MKGDKNIEITAVNGGKSIYIDPKYQENIFKDGLSVGSKDDPLSGKFLPSDYFKGNDNTIYVSVFADIEKAFPPIPPKADFSIEQKIPKNNKVKFIDKSDYSLNWRWDFGDGTYSKIKNPEHLYKREGVFEVVLTVSNEYGKDTKNKTIIVINK
jgi:PKD repeat protein